jgi:predicted polyphosphate/ATP-dependent NAD kinase
VTSNTTSVGIIANPASGSDIRRLVALSTVFGAQEKISIVQRLLSGLDATGIERIYLMPDAFGISRMALAKLPMGLASMRQKARLLDMPVENSAEDSVCAARQMRELGVGCIVVLGGDGTNRAVAKGCGEVPILPVSTGTNNVVPYLVEGTVAGLAAGFVAQHPEVLTQVAYRSKRLEICQNGRGTDTALVDVAVVEGNAVGSRAVWEPRTLRQVILTRGDSGAMGVSSLSGFSVPLSPTEPRGVCFWLGEPRVCRVTVLLAPGLMASLGIEKIRQLAIGDSVTVQGGERLLALDGEREIALRKDQSVRIYLRDDGPWFVDVFRALQEATAQGIFVNWSTCIH